MKIRVVDCKNNEVMKVKIEVNKFMFLVVPEVIDPKFNYLRNRLMNIRNKFMNVYVGNDNINYDDFEFDIYQRMFDELVTEFENIHRTEGIMYYTL